MAIEGSHRGEAQSAGIRNNAKQATANTEKTRTTVETMVLLPCSGSSKELMILRATLLFIVQQGTFTILFGKVLCDST